MEVVSAELLLIVLTREMTQAKPENTDAELPRAQQNALFSFAGNHAFSMVFWLLGSMGVPKIQKGESSPYGSSLYDLDLPSRSGASPIVPEIKTGVGLLGITMANW